MGLELVRCVWSVLRYWLVHEYAWAYSAFTLSMYALPGKPRATPSTYVVTTNKA